MLIVSYENLQITQISVALLNSRAQNLLICFNVIILLLLAQIFVEKVLKLLIELNDIFFKINRESQLLWAILLGKFHKTIRFNFILGNSRRMLRRNFEWLLSIQLELILALARMYSTLLNALRWLLDVFSSFSYCFDRLLVLISANLLKWKSLSLKRNLYLLSRILIKLLIFWQQPSFIRSVFNLSMLLHHFLHLLDVLVMLLCVVFWWHSWASWVIISILG